MSGATDPVNVIYKFKRTMQEQLDALVQTLANGGIDNYEEYKYIQGKIHMVDICQQEFSRLLEDEEKIDD